MSSFSKAIYQQLREIVPVFADDTIMYPKITAIKQYLAKTFIEIPTEMHVPVLAKTVMAEAELELCPV
jgi:histidine ammonia-lyase